MLARLLQLYRRGLTEPVHVFPECALAYCLKRAPPMRAPPWQPRGRRGIGWRERAGRAADPYNRLCHPSNTALDDEFRRLAVEVFGPLLDHCESI